MSAPEAAAAKAGAAAETKEAPSLLDQVVAATRPQSEPHSPIPFLIKRAVELGALGFPQLLKELVRDAAALSDVQRFVGIKEEQTPQSS